MLLLRPAAMAVEGLVGLTAADTFGSFPCLGGVPAVARVAVALWRRMLLGVGEEYEAEKVLLTFGLAEGSRPSREVEVWADERGGLPSRRTGED